MSQNDFSLANQAGASFRSDVNSAFQAAVTKSSGTAAPSTTYQFQDWVDTSSGTLLKIRNGGNSAWMTYGSIGTGGPVPYSNGSPRPHPKDMQNGTGTFAPGTGDSIIFSPAGTGDERKVPIPTFMASFSPAEARISYIVANGAAGGASVAGSWTQYPLTSEDYDTGTFVSIGTGSGTAGTNTFRLTTGSYGLTGAAIVNVVNATNKARIRLYNVSDGTQTGEAGPTMQASDGGTESSYCGLPPTRFSVSGTKVFEIQYHAAVALGTIGLGSPSSSGVNEMYAWFTISKFT